MKTIGLIGGMSWESTTLYYQIMNSAIASRLGGLNSANVLLASLNFAEIAAMQREGQWEQLAAQLSDAACRLEKAGADCMLIGTNTMHLVAPQVQNAIRIPLLHIADAAAVAIRTHGLNRVGLLGTRFTMEQPFYSEHLNRYGIETVVPDAENRVEVHRIIFEELCRGRILDSSRRTLLGIADELSAQGAQGLILGCTELPLLLQQQHTSLPLFDTTTLHALAAVDFALGDRTVSTQPQRTKQQAPLPA